MQPQSSHTRGTRLNETAMLDTREGERYTLCDIPYEQSIVYAVRSVRV